MVENPVNKRRPSALESVFGKRKAIIGVVHSRPLPGSPGYEGEAMDAIYAYAVAEAERYAAGGMDGVILENHGDIPFLKPEDIGHETAAAMAVMADRVRRAVKLPVGINVLANGALTATAVAKAAGAAFIRVNQWANAYVANEGLIEGPAAKATRYRAWLRAQGLKIFADVHVKHGAHAIVADRSIPELTRDAEFFDADVIIATGQRTGDCATRDEIVTIKDATQLPVVVGSGVGEDTVEDVLSLCDGVIVASSLKRDGVWWNEVDPDRVRRFMNRARAVR
ncbi:MAG: BtpA/SgcQ family protein [Dongiaceae bacterium]